MGPARPARLAQDHARPDRALACGADLLRLPGATRVARAARRL